MESGAEVVLVDTEKIAGAVEAADAGVLRRAVAATGDTLPVGALLGVIAEAEVPDAEIDAFVQQFQDTFVPEEAGGEEDGDRIETVQVGDLTVAFLRQGCDDRTAVLLHGFGGDLDNWLFNHPALSSDRTVIAVDLPGHGRSTKEVGDGSFAFLADVVHDTLRKLDVAEADWVGHSMGGAIALHLAQSRPQIVRSLTLLASARLGPEINTNTCRASPTAAAAASSNRTSGSSSAMSRWSPVNWSRTCSSTSASTGCSSAWKHWPAGSPTAPVRPRTRAESATPSLPW